MDYFNLKFHNTTVKSEIFAGIVMFMSMSYILVVSPTVLSQTGMAYKGVFVITALVSGITTIVSAFYTKLPIALAPGLGLVGIFANFATGPKALSWQSLLLATYVAGIILCMIVNFGIYDKIMEIMDERFRRIIMSGIGLALLLYGISTTGLIEKTENYYVLGQLQPIPVFICSISLLLIFAMKRSGKKGFVLIGLAAAYVMSIFYGYCEVSLESGISLNEYLVGIFSLTNHYEDVKTVMFAFPDIMEVCGSKEQFFAFANAVFAFTMAHFFDAVGTNTASFDAINEDIDSRMKNTVSLKRAIAVDGVGNIISGLFGTSSVTTYCESLVGIVSGGKTGITALVAGVLFLCSLFFAPLFTSVATYVAAPALIYVGMKLVLRLRELEVPDKGHMLFGLCLVLYIGITFNVGKAVLYGLTLYVILKRCLWKEKIVSYSWIVCAFAAFEVALNYLA